MKTRILTAAIGVPLLFIIVLIYIFVHVESYYVFERYLTFLVQFDQGLVHAEWR